MKTSIVFLSQKTIFSKCTKIMYRHTNNPMAGKIKNAQNYISTHFPDGHTKTVFTPLSPFETQEAVDCIFEEYKCVIDNLELEPLIAIPIFIHDFLCIHPFVDGNGRISRLLTALLLYRSGFYIGKYISLEAKIAKNKDLYYDSLLSSQSGWHEEKEDATPFIKYFLGILLSAYKDLSDRLDIMSKGGSAIDIVRNASQNKLGRFTKQDIIELCPSLSLSSLSKARSES